MMRLFAILLSLLPLSIFAQPAVNTGGVVNAGSGAAPGLPNAGIAQGSMFLVYGSNLGPANLAQVFTYPIPASFAGTSVKISAGGLSIEAPIVYTSRQQIAAILPSRTPIGAASLTVTYNGQTSSPVSFQVVSRSFGAFSLNFTGGGPGAIRNFNTPLDQPVNTLIESVKPGQTVILYGTGLGAVTGDEAAGPLPGAMPLTDLHVFVGAKEAVVSYAGRSGDSAAVDQVQFIVPTGIEGCYVPVAVQIRSAVSPFFFRDVVGNFTTMSISSNSKHCSDPLSYTDSDLQTLLSNGKLRTGSIAMTRSEFPNPTSSLRTDAASARFTALTADQVLRGFGTVNPVLGSCIVSTFKGTTPPVLPSSGMPLDAGNVLNVSGPGGAKQIALKDPGNYSSALGSSYLEPGAYIVNNGSGGSGANAVGPFQVNLTIPSLLKWENADQIGSVLQSQALTVTWSGGDLSGAVLILGFSADSTANVGGTFLCNERNGAGKFVVPAYVLSALPSSNSLGFVSVGSFGQAVRFTATGLDGGFFNYGANTVKIVSFTF
jgi:uncharacterized protein (TIGR03437 family)